MCRFVPYTSSATIYSTAQLLTTVPCCYRSKSLIDEEDELLYGDASGIQVKEEARP